MVPAKPSFIGVATMVLLPVRAIDTEPPVAVAVTEKVALPAVVAVPPKVKVRAVRAVEAGALVKEATTVAVPDAPALMLATPVAGVITSVPAFAPIVSVSVDTKVRTTPAEFTVRVYLTFAVESVDTRADRSTLSQARPEEIPAAAVGSRVTVLAVEELPVVMVPLFKPL